MAGFDFEAGLQVMLFLVAIWGFGRGFQILRLPPILGQIAAGILCGPRMLDIVPYASNGMCDSIANPQPDPSGSMSGSGSGADSCSWVMWERFESGHHLTDIWRFIGNVGVTLMIMESGMHIHFDKVALVGKKAFGVAVVGTGLPIVTGFLAVGERLPTLLNSPPYSTSPHPSARRAFLKHGLVTCVVPVGLLRGLCIRAHFGRHLDQAARRI